MRLWVNGLDILRYAGHVPDDQQNHWEWVVCPACLCVGRIPRYHLNRQPRCQAPETGELSMLRTRSIKVGGKLEQMECGDSVWLADLSPRINQILETAFRLRGLAPVIDILDSLGVVEIGLDDPGGAPHSWTLARSRPKSIKKKYKKRGTR
jgi:hypothetical protein